MNKPAKFIYKGGSGKQLGIVYDVTYELKTPDGIMVGDAMSTGMRKYKNFTYRPAVYLVKFEGSEFSTKVRAEDFDRISYLSEEQYILEKIRM